MWNKQLSKKNGCAGAELLGRGVAKEGKRDLRINNGGTHCCRRHDVGASTHDDDAGDAIPESHVCAR